MRRFFTFLAKRFCVPIFPSLFPFFFLVACVGMPLEKKVFYFICFMPIILLQLLASVKESSPRRAVAEMIAAACRNGALVCARVRRTP